MTKKIKRTNVIKTLIMVFVLLASYLTISVVSKAINFSQSGFAYFISTQYGEDASKEATIHYHSEVKNTYAMVTLEEDETFANAVRKDALEYDLIDYKTPEVDPNKKNETIGHPLVSYEVTIRMTDLTPGTKYKYYITNGSDKSEVYHFETATGDSSSFAFAYTTDPQQYGDPKTAKGGRWDSYYQWGEKIWETSAINNIPLKFVMNGGDISEHGGDANYWNLVFAPDYWKKSAFMAAPGNHDFTPLISSGGVDGRYFSSMFGNPYNGVLPKEQFGEINYFFKYNDALFCILSCSYLSRTAQAEWLEKTIQDNPSRYIIVVCHYPASSGTDSAQEFKPIFDKYGVDLYLYGHTHTYKLEKYVYNGKKTGDESKGTTYMSVSSPDREEETQSFITVTEDGIKVVNMMHNKNIEVDRFTILPKRPKASEIKEFTDQSFIDSVSFVKDTKTYKSLTMKWGDMVYGNVLKVDVIKEDGTLAGSQMVYGSDVNVPITGLKPDTVYKFTAKLHFKDGSTKEFTFDANTNKEYGELENFTLAETDNGYRASFRCNFVSAVTALKAYVNGEFYQEFKLDARKITIPYEILDSTKVNTITIKLVVEEGKEVEYISYNYGSEKTEYTISYDLAGGTCLDLVEKFFDASLVILPNPTKEGFKFLGWYEGETKVTTLENKNYSLVAKYAQIFSISYNLDGGKLDNLVKEYTEGETVTLGNPTKEGFTFLGWYEGETKVTSITAGNHNLVAKWQEIKEEPQASSGCNGKVQAILTGLALLGLLIIRKRKY